MKTKLLFMVNDWYDISLESRNYIHERFIQYGIDGKDAFYDETLFPEEIRKLDSEQIVELLKTKDISHVLPQSEFPDLANDINNIVLEDFSVNRARGAEIMSHEEINVANNDYINDIESFEDGLSVLDDLPEILVGSTTIGLGLTAYSAYSKIKKNEIQFNEVPRYMLVNAGGKVVKCAVIGVCLKSGSVILVSATVAYFIFKSRHLLIRALNITWNVLTHPVSLKAYAISGVITLAIIGGSINVIKYTSNTLWNIATHETTKEVAKGTVDLTGKVLSNTAKGVWNVATHETTKEVAKGTLDVSGKILTTTAKGAWNIATHETTKDVAKGTVLLTGKLITGTAKGLFNVSKFLLKKK